MVSFGDGLESMGSAFVAEQNPHGLLRSFDRRTMGRSPKKTTGIRSASYLRARG
jgi:hypothetical protein